MSITLEKFNTVKKGLAELVGSAYSMSQNMGARVKTPVLEDGTNLWETYLDSKTIQLYGGVNEDQRHRFKIDHAFDLVSIVNASISQDGSISINKERYNQSQGTEFIIISQKELKGAEADYAIRADKYASVREQLNKGKFKANELEKAGGFKINEHLTPKESLNSDGWKELAVGKNKAAKDDYDKAGNMLKDYVSKAQENKCFSGKTGMGFFVNPSEKDYKARPWVVSLSGCRSIADGGGSFDGSGRFLRVSQSQKNSIGNEPQEITITEEGIIGYLNKNPVKDERFAKVLLNSANAFYQKQ